MPGRLFELKKGEGTCAENCGAMIEVPVAL
jgi:hypothetical protein